MKMDDIAALAPQMAAQASPEIFQQLGTITRQLHDTLHQAVGASKLKMWVHGRPATLRQSLAYWNLADGAHVEMSVGK